MTLDEIKTFCTLRGDQVADDVFNYAVVGARRLVIKTQKRMFTVVYYTNPSTGRVTMLSGRVSTIHEILGTQSSELYSLESVEKML